MNELNEDQISELLEFYESVGLLNKPKITELKEHFSSNYASKSSSILNADNTNLADDSQQVLVEDFLYNSNYTEAVPDYIKPTAAMLDVSQTDQDYFTIAWQNSKGYGKRWWFALLPAIQSNSSSSGQPPEVKPGILKRSGMAIKPFTIPGAPPVMQVLGLEATIMQLTGLFIGAEVMANSGETGQNTFLAYNAYDAKSSLNAYEKAKAFDYELVQVGRRSNLKIYSKAGMSDPAMILMYDCLIQNFRYFIAKSDRVYYSMDLIILNYKHNSLTSVADTDDVPIYVGPVFPGGGR